MNAQKTLLANELGMFQRFLKARAGIHLADHKSSLVQSRLQNRLYARQVNTYSDYHHLIHQPGEEDELARCVEALTTNETFFFRHEAHWDYLKQQALPDFMGPGGPSRPLRVWSAASSNGSEAYSVAILLNEVLGPHGFSIEASDINRCMLNHARTGIYDRYAMQKVDDLCRQRWFTDLGDQRWQVRPSLSNQICWYQHNLLDQAPSGHCDIIFLRNVLIYFDDHTRERVLEQVVRRLRPGGLLFLGGSETLRTEVGSWVRVGPAVYRFL